jgi:hypothetical protein
LNKWVIIGLFLLPCFNLLATLAIKKGKADKVKAFNVLLLVEFIISFFIVLFTLLFNNANQDQSDRIEKTTHNTETQVGVLDTKADNSIKKMDSLQDENISLQDKVISLQNSQIEKNKEIIEIGEKLKLATLENQKAIESNIFLTKKAMHPLPESVVLSFEVYFKLNAKKQKEADDILTYLPNKANSYQLVDNSIAYKILGANIFNHCRLTFISKENVIMTQEDLKYTGRALLDLSGNIGIEDFNNVRINYNTDTKFFLVTYNNFKVSTMNYNMQAKLSPNLGPNSIFDLEKSMVFLWIGLNENQTREIKVKDLYVRSNELTLTFNGELVKKKSNNFICTSMLDL